MTRQADWVTFHEASEAILAAAQPLGPETRAGADCSGRVLAERIEAPMDLPHRDNSAMDGFAVRAEDIEAAGPDAPVSLRVTAAIPAGGQPGRPVEPGCAIRIMTGAPVPEGADTVVRIEHTNGGSDAAGERRVMVYRSNDARRNIRRRGEEVRRGGALLEPGTVLGPAHLGLAAAAGRARLRVVRRPRVALLTSGDELVEVDRFHEVLEGGKIVSTNSYSMAARIRAAGCEVVDLGISPDDPAELKHRLRQARGFDVLVTTAGVSVGDHDYLLDVLDGLGLDLRFWRVKMRPGSPNAFGVVRELGELRWFGLPGNPVSALVGCEVFVLPCLLKMAGHTRPHLPRRTVRLASPLRLKEGLTHFVRVRYVEEGVVEPTGAQGSSLLTSMALADGLLVVPEGGELEAGCEGEVVEVRPR